ncbi:ATP-binding protein [Streptomyces sp. CS113]|nr:ATP-binding protein [Streptomyces sp. CS113]
MQHTGGDLRQSPDLVAEVSTAQRVLLTLAVRDYAEDEDDWQGDQAAAFAEGIDRQVDVVGEWWATPGPEPAFLQVPPPALKSRDHVEDFLRQHNVRGLASDALVLFVTGHGLKVKSPTHFLKLPATEQHRPLATAVRTADIVAAALDSNARNVLVIVNTCFAGKMAPELASLYEDIAHSRRRGSRLDVLVTCGHDSKIAVLKFPTLLESALRRLRRTAGITTPHLSVPDFMAEYVRGLREDEEQTFKLHHLVQGGNYQPSPCLPNPGYTHMPELLGASGEREPLAAEHWLDRATGRPHERDGGWYFRGRRELNAKVAAFLGPQTARGVLLITGSAGTGKSAVLGRAVLMSEPAFRDSPLFKTAYDLASPETVPPPGSVDAAVLAHRRNAAQVAEDLLRALGSEPADAGSRDAAEVWAGQLLDFVHDQGRTVTLVVDGLDEAREQTRIVEDILKPLSQMSRPRVPGQRLDEDDEGQTAAVRLVIGVRSSTPLRPPTDQDGGQDRSLLRALKDALPGARVERTDGPSSKADIREYLQALIAGIAGQATVDQVAELAAEAVWPSFIDARLAGQQLRTAADPLALACDEAWQRLLKRGVQGLLTRDLHLVAEDGLPSDVGLALLKASAHAKGEGIPWADVWPTVADVFLVDRTLTPAEWDEMIEKLLHGRLSGYLAHSVEDERRVYRPAHQELTDVLRNHAVDLLHTGAGDA